MRRTIIRYDSQHGPASLDVPSVRVESSDPSGVVVLGEREEAIFIPWSRVYTMITREEKD